MTSLSKFIFEQHLGNPFSTTRHQGNLYVKRCVLRFPGCCRTARDVLDGTAFCSFSFANDFGVRGSAVFQKVLDIRNRRRQTRRMRKRRREEGEEEEEEQMR